MEQSPMKMELLMVILEFLYKKMMDFVLMDLISHKEKYTMFFMILVEKQADMLFKEQ